MNDNHERSYYVALPDLISDARLVIGQNDTAAAREYWPMASTTGNDSHEPAIKIETQLRRPMSNYKGRRLQAKAQ
jgi:hypothetical protein